MNEELSTTRRLTFNSTPAKQCTSTRRRKRTHRDAVDFRLLNTCSAVRNERIGRKKKHTFLHARPWGPFRAISDVPRQRNNCDRDLGKSTLRRLSRNFCNQNSPVVWPQRGRISFNAKILVIPHVVWLRKTRLVEFIYFLLSLYVRVLAVATFSFKLR